jgi:NSS family neurotransmitter:Na+ symporter
MELWTSRAGFLLAAIGSAVGIGNIWRFSSVVGQNGGGAYLIPYLTACLLCALPLMSLELAAGRAVGGGVVSAFSSAVRRGNAIGWFISVIVFFILSYYLVITGWTLAFSCFFAAGSPESFAQFTGSYQPIFFFITCAVLTGAIVAFGVKAGIERISTILIPLIFVILALLAIAGTSLPGFSAGITYFLSPDFSVLAHPSIWIAAFGQAFFSLSVGQGILITYGAYIGKEIDLFSSALIIMILDFTASILAGLVIFPIVFSYGLSPAMGAELAFVTLPKAFLLMPYGSLIAFTFFLLLFFAAITSAISLLEVNVAALINATHLTRTSVCIILTGLIIIAGIPAALSYSAVDLTIQGVRVLDLMDEIFGSIGLIVTALLTAFFLSRFGLQKKIQDELGGKQIIRSMVITICRTIIPLLLVAALIIKIAADTDFPDWHILNGIPPVGGVTLLVTAIIVFGLLMLSVIMVCHLKKDRCPWRHWLRQ